MKHCSGGFGIVGLSLFALSLSHLALADTPEIQMVLRLRERVSMERLAENVSNPASPNYRHYYTPEQIRDLAAPGAEDYAVALRVDRRVVAVRKFQRSEAAGTQVNHGEGR